MDGAPQSLHRLQRQHLDPVLAHHRPRHRDDPRADDRRPPGARRGRLRSRHVPALRVPPEPLGEVAHPQLETLRAARQGMLVGGTLTQLLASLGTPYAFDPPPGCVLFLDEVGERPYRLDRMLTQLRLSGTARADGGVVFGELPRLRRAGRRRSGGARGRCRCAGGLSGAGAVRPAVRAHHRRHADAAVRRARARRRRARPSLVIEEAACGVVVMARIHLIGVCGTAMATLAAMLKSRGTTSAAPTRTSIRR